MKKQNAFTLAELLVSIVIISVILTLLAPVITKRAKESSKSASSTTTTTNSRVFTYNKSDADCSEISGTNSLECSFTVPAGVVSLGAVAVAAGGGGAGATQPSIQYDKLVIASNTSDGASKTQEIEITNSMKNIRITSLFGAGAGGGGAAWTNKVDGGDVPASQSECAKYNAAYIPPEWNGGSGVCVTKYNGGDPNGPKIPSSVRTVTAGSKSCDDKACCWQGTTVIKATATDINPGDSYGKSYTTCTTVGGYSGCTRTVCTWYAADDICKNHSINGVSGWRLPTTDEMSAWARIEKLALYGFGYDISFWAEDMLLCNWGGARWDYFAMCNPKVSDGLCKGARSDDCGPYGLWSGTPGDNKDEYWGIELSNIFTAHRVNDYNEAYSVRCVLGGTQTLTALSGGGGGAGAYIKNYTIPNDVITQNIGGKIVLKSGAGGSGGTSASDVDGSGNNGTDGGESSILVYASDNTTLKWGLRVPGGYAGKGATASAVGAGGSQRALNTCQIYQNGSWSNINCTGAGARGNDGAEYKNASSTNTAIGGKGANSLYTSSAQGGGAGGTYSDENGFKGSTYGAGGGGATIAFDSSNNAQKGRGGYGANGVAEIKYDVVYPAAAGGGGGGGAYVSIEEIPVSAGNTYTIKIGAPGLGGTIATAGEDAGESSITFDSITYTLPGGKGGKIGTSATSTADAVQGLGGAGGEILTSVTDTSKVKYKYGENGSDAKAFTKDETHANSSGYGGAYGGVGGKSGLDITGGCGGLFIDSAICANTTVNGIYNSFAAPSISGSEISYGSAGAGGGGGGWSENTTNFPNPGSGAQGQGGYVFLYWRE